MTDLSVIVVSWNTCSILRQCLKSIYKQIRDIVFEVIVIDNASTDGSVEMIRSEFPGVTLIVNDTNRGFAAANNQGIYVAQGRYILLLNSDTIVLDHAIDKVVAFADVHSEAAVVGCRVLNQDRTLQPTCFMFPCILNMLLSTTYLYKLFPKSKFFGRERMTWWDRKDTREVDVLTGCFMLVRQKAIEQVGLMDEQFFMYGEETDWCYRFKQAGWKVMFAPVAEIVHIGGASTDRMTGDMTLQLRGSVLRFIDKYHSKGRYVLACILTGMFFALRIPFWLIRILASPKNRLSSWSMVKVYSKAVFRLLHGSQGLSVKAQKLRT